MPSTTSTKGLSKKTSDKASKKSKKAEQPKKHALELAPEPEPTVSSDEDEEDEDSDNGGVDEKGLERLMNALGDDGLDEFEQAQLRLAMGDGEGSDEVEEDEDEGDEDGEGEGSEEVDGEEDQEEDDSEDEEAEDQDMEEEEDIALEDADDIDEDAVPRQKVEIDNEVALARIRESIQLDPSMPWTETLSLSYPHTIDVDVNDDLNRELAFYKQALHGAQEAKKLATKLNFPFTRPSDYFAEMVKNDGHMERIRQRLLDESASIKKSDEKRKEREGKKFGKQVQIEKLKEREKGKKEMEERLKGLKRKRKDILENPTADDDAFDIAVEDAISDRPAKRGRAGSSAGGSKLSRQSRDKKYGFGGAGRRSKQNTKESTDNFDFGSRKGAGGRGGGGARGGGRGGRGGRGGGRGGGAKRLGKSRRMDARSKS